MGAQVYAFGAFDGHGGARAAQLLSELLPSALQPVIGSSDKEACALEAFEAVDAAILERAAAEGWDDGSTAIIGCIDGCRLTLLNVGDCGAVLCSKGEGEGARRVALCTPHRPTEPSEAQRLRAIGVEVSGEMAGRVGSQYHGLSATDRSRRASRGI